MQDLTLFVPFLASRTQLPCWTGGRDTELDEYIEQFYNRTQRHSHLSGISPEAFEAMSMRAY